jgi:hypothetical protein
LPGQTLLGTDHFRKSNYGILQIQITPKQDSHEKIFSVRSYCSLLVAGCTETNLFEESYGRCGQRVRWRI